MENELPVVHLGEVNNPQIVYGIDPAFDGAIAQADIEDRIVTVTFSSRDPDQKRFIDALVQNLFLEYDPLIYPPGGEFDSPPAQATENLQDGI